MAESLDTTRAVYERFLDKIKKESTGIVPPIAFNRIANDGQEEWLELKLLEIEKNQKRIDDIRVIRPVPLPIIGASGSKTFPMPDGVTVSDAITGTTLPKYHRFLSVAFKITYVNNVCGLTGISDWIRDVHVLRSDQRNWILTSPRRKPNDSKIYYDMKGGTITIETGTSSTAYRMEFDYVRPPRMIFFDSSNPNVEDPTVSYTAGAGCVNFEFPNRQKDEIIDRMVSMHLERLKEERYRTWLQEEMMKVQSK